MDDHVLNRGHRNLQQIGISSVREMRVDFSTRTSIQRNEFVHEVLACLLCIGGIAVEVREAVLGDGAVGDFRLEEIHLIQEKDQGRVLEPV